METNVRLSESRQARLGTHPGVIWNGWVGPTCMVLTFLTDFWGSFSTHRRFPRDRLRPCVSLRLILPALHKSQVGEGRVGGEGADPPPWDRPPDLIPIVGRREAGPCLLSGEISPPVSCFTQTLARSPHIGLSLGF
ncbi:hypothetical protein B296_00047875 [Ensete ventricosum]|uniref:Uncharacterized protein n=1 Tax=Ensete ventricosum TaxID=4639 RepID=A0A426YXI5_ENSVE|nr:hypothetical protein B296_00047875 [Ensete ventricosum]